MPAPRTFVTALSAAALMLVLAGCQKPTPSVTLQSNGELVRAEATAFCEGGKSLAKESDCPGTENGVTLLQVRPGQPVTVDVDKHLAESGWMLVDVEAQRVISVEDDHFASFVPDFSNRPVAGLINLQVRQLDHTPTSNNDTPKILGLWKFQLVQQT